MEKQGIFVLLLAIVISIFLVGIPLITASQNYAEIPTANHSETKAICNDKNFCEDYELFCENNELIELRATGFVAQFSPSWQDLRTDKEKEISCNN